MQLLASQAELNLMLHGSVAQDGVSREGVMQCRLVYTMQLLA